MISKAMVVLSGGQDSTTCLYWAKRYFSEVHAVTFDYGQSHSRELESAAIIAKMAGVASHEVVKIPSLAGTSPLTNKSETLETYENAEQMEAVIGNRVEKTFVPMRNMIFLTYALNRAIALGIWRLVTGVCQEDNANYPDCRRMFVEATAHAATLALGGDRSDVDESVVIYTPLMDLTKADTVRLAASMPDCMKALAYSHTAYSGEYPPKTQDHATVLRAKGFEEAGVPDPLIVRAWQEGLADLPGTANYDILRK